MFRLQVTTSSGISDADTVNVTVVDDPQDKNTVTYHNLLWQAGDAYGLGLIDIFLSPLNRPDLFYRINSPRPIEVSLKLDTSPLWIPVPYKGNNLYTYDYSSVNLWIMCFPNDATLVGRMGSIKIKL